MRLKPACPARPISTARSLVSSLVAASIRFAPTEKMNVFAGQHQTLDVLVEAVHRLVKRCNGLVIERVRLLVVCALSIVIMASLPALGWLKYVTLNWVINSSAILPPFEKSAKRTTFRLLTFSHIVAAPMPSPTHRVVIRIWSSD